jgi:hypothetical protein
MTWQKSLHFQDRYKYFSNIFAPWLVKLTDAELMDTEDLGTAQASSFAITKVTCLGVLGRT